MRTSISSLAALTMATGCLPAGGRGAERPASISAQAERTCIDEFVAYRRQLVFAELAAYAPVSALNAPTYASDESYRTECLRFGGPATRAACNSGSSRACLLAGLAATE